MSHLNRVRLSINRFSEFLVITMIIVLVVVVAAQVFWRYVLSNSLSWSGELSRFLFIWVIFLGADITLREKAHVAVDSLLNSLRGFPKLLLSILIDIIIIGFTVIVFFSGLDLVQITWSQPSSALNIPTGLVYMAIPISMGLMTMNLLYSIAKKLKDRTVNDTVQSNTDEAI